MADIEDVCAALATSITNLAYPSGTTAPSTIGVPLQVAQGWPLEQTLEQIAARPGVTVSNPVTLVSIYPVPGTTADGGTVMDFAPALVSSVTPGIAVSIDSTETVVTFAGQACGGEVATIIANGSTAYGYICQPSDTAEVVAAALAIEAAEGNLPQAAWMPETGSISIPGTQSLVARVGTGGTFGRKVHRQKTQIRIVVWSSTPTDRKAVASQIDTMIKAAVAFPMPDTSNAILTYQGTNLSDNAERQGLYRRDLIFSALFDTIEEFAGVEVTSFGLQLTPPATAASTTAS